MIMSPLNPTDDLGTSIRAFPKIIKPLFKVAAATLMKAVDEGAPMSFVEVLVPEARTLRTPSSVNS